MEAARFHDCTGLGDADLAPLGRGFLGSLGPRHQARSHAGCGAREATAHRLRGVWRPQSGAEGGQPRETAGDRGRSRSSAGFTGFTGFTGCQGLSGSSASWAAWSSHGAVRATRSAGTSLAQGEPHGLPGPLMELRRPLGPLVQRKPQQRRLHRLRGQLMV